MDAHAVWVFAHIMLFVYWLGGDLGVFVLANMVKNGKLSFETRATLLQGAMLVDLVPRLCFALMLPVGLTLAGQLDLIDMHRGWTIAAWAVALAWCWLILSGPKWANDPAARERARTASLLGQSVLGALTIGAAILSLIDAGGPFRVDWLAWKALFYGLCFPAAIMIDVAFGPLGPAFARLATDGSTPELECEITRVINRTFVWVLMVYALVALAGFFGTVKP
jgi:hypothetical protein